MSELNDQDIRDHVLGALNEWATWHDVDAIVRELIERFDLTGDHPRDTLKDIPDADFWAIADRHRAKGRQ